MVTPSPAGAHQSAEPQHIRGESHMQRTPTATVASTEASQKVRPQTKSWSSLFSSSSQPGRVNLSYEEVTSVDGKFIITGTPEEVEEGEAHWRNSLVGHFIGRRPPFHIVKARVEAMWKPTGSMEVLTLPSGFFIFRFGLAEDKDKILEGGPWFVQSRLLVLKPWDPNMKLEKLDFSAIPVWVKIHNLLLHLWSPTLIARIASCIGKPMYMDQPTASRTRVGFARVCIEISSNKELPDHLQFSFNNGVQDHQLTLEYDWKPPKCSHCHTFGHATVKCPLQQNRPKTAWVPKKQQQATVEVATATPTKAQILIADSAQAATAVTASNPNTPKSTVRDKGKSIVQQTHGTNIVLTTNSFQCLEAQSELEETTHPPGPPDTSSGAEAPSSSTNHTLNV